MKLDIPDLAEELSLPPTSKGALSPKLDLRLLLSLALVCATVISYYPVRYNGFIGLDDPYYVTENPDVQQGLTLKSVTWAFTSTKAAAYWHPVTWLSHMADCYLFGLDPAAHHLMNLLFHVLNAVLLFLLLNRMTGALWRSAFVAGLFALHPLNVESVAWIAERKNVLSTFLCLLTIWAYVTFVRRPSARNYIAVLVVFALGLMSKPMLVTLPFLLLLLDVWPLGRIGISDFSPPPDDSESRAGFSKAVWLLREKLPLFALAVAASLITLRTQAPAITSLQNLPLTTRLSHALVAYLDYCYGLVWPVGLAAFYPYQPSVPAVKVALAIALLLAVSLVAVWGIRSRPYLMVGWLWFLGTLVPVIGIVQSGTQARADRFVYIPFIGLFVILSWGLADVLTIAPRLRPIAVGVCLTILALLASDTHKQLGYWRDTITLFTRALEVTEDNPMAEMIVAGQLNEKGDRDAAMAHALAALRMQPRNGSIYYTIGRMKLQQGMADEAENYFRQALKYPNSPQLLGMMHDRVAFLLEQKGDLANAEAEFKQAIRLNPEESYYSRLNLALVLQREGHFDDAAEQYATLIKDAPTEPSLYFLLGKTREQQGQFRDAAAAFRKTLELQPGYAPAEIELKAMASEESKTSGRVQSRKTAPL